MSQQASHTPGRHRRLARHASLSGRARTTLLSSTLGAALLAGAIGGSAAAAEEKSHRHHPAAANTTTTVQEDPEASANLFPAMFGADPLPGRPVAARPGKKSRVVVKPKVTAAQAPEWVNPNPTAVVTSCFGRRWGRLHAGVDLAAPAGTPIVAAGAGVVIRAGEDEGYGNAVLIDHGDGFLTHYAHLSVIRVVVGQRVTTGQQIGDEGETGHATGPHLHFEVHEGYYKNPIDPLPWLHLHGVDITGCEPA